MEFLLAHIVTLNSSGCAPRCEAAASGCCSVFSLYKGRAGFPIAASLHVPPTGEA